MRWEPWAAADLSDKGEVQGLACDAGDWPSVESAMAKTMARFGRLGRPEETASLICWLASKENSLSSGAVFDSSGGRAVY